MQLTEITTMHGEIIISEFSPEEQKFFYVSLLNRMKEISKELEINNLKGE